KGFRVRSVHGSPAVAPCRDEANVAQDLEMLRDRRLAQLQGVGDLVDRAFFGRKEFQDVSAAGLRDGVERIRVRRGARHAVVIYSHVGISQGPTESPQTLTNTSWA